MKVIEGLHYKSQQPIRLYLDQGIIQRVESIASGGDDWPMLAPGLVDLQINGYQGININGPQLSRDDVCITAMKVAASGVTSFYATVITNSDEAIAHKVRIIHEACTTDERVGKIIRGIHLEGPFISPQDGPRGVHNKRYVKAPDWELFERWQDAAQGMIRIVTISPEWEGAAAFIERCVNQGVVVSIGHTSASPEHIHQAVAAGATMCTHLGNGAHLDLPRHPNYIWEQLAHDELWPCMIPDGFHLPESVMKVFMKVKPEQIMLVSDAVYLSGMPPGTYSTPLGGEVVLTEEGRTHRVDNIKLLSGSSKLLPACVEHLIRKKLCSLSDAWMMASVRPAAFMKLPEAAGLAMHAPADVVVFRREEDRILVDEVYKAGRILGRGGVGVYQ